MEENNEVVEETTQQPVEETTEQKQEESHVSFNEDGDIKVDLNKFNELNKEQDAVSEPQTEEVPVRDESEASEGVQQENVETTNEELAREEEQTVQNEESATTENVEEEQIVEMPENIQKLMNFMEETGGDLADYVRLNTDIKDLDDSEVLNDYYKLTKPHLDNEEINFLLEDKFSYDEDEADEKEIRRKKLALKEQVAEARAYLDGQKSKYYEDIKAGSKLTSEQQQAIEFYNNYSQEEEQNLKVVKQQQEAFLNKTNQVFNNEFKGFEFNVGDKTITYNIQDVEKTKNTQTDINNFVGKFLNDKSIMEDAAGYHKGLFTAMNPDAIAKHFYEQGKSDAIKQTVSETKNIDTSRQSHKVYEGEGGIKFRVLGEDSNDMKLRIKKRN
mgnify:FL=1|jgi:hypothetical protein|tara:strand:- start:5 stop:1165 length:1161 start_codon:yes stop_codon:yes gene_type:complete